MLHQGRCVGNMGLSNKVGEHSLSIGHVAMWVKRGGCATPTSYRSALNTLRSTPASDLTTPAAAASRSSNALSHKPPLDTRIEAIDSVMVEQGASGDPTAWDRDPLLRMCSQLSIITWKCKKKILELQLEPQTQTCLERSFRYPPRVHEGSANGSSLCL